VIQGLLDTWPLCGVLYQPRRMIGDGECGAFGGMSGKGNRSTRRKPASVPLSTTDPTWPDLGTNPGCPCGKLVTNRLTSGRPLLHVSFNL
jgi:hypothetical protein